MKSVVTSTPFHSGIYLLITSNDISDFHAYPGEDIPLDQIAENFGVHLTPGKPVVGGVG